MRSYNLCMANILNVSGRTRRFDFFIALVVMAIIISVLSFLTKAPIIGFVFGIIAWIYGIISTVAAITMTLRRLKDAGFSRWLALLYFVPGIGAIAVFVLCCFPTK